MNIQLSPPVSFNTVARLPLADNLLAISEQRKSGLILCKEFHAEFAGPGAAISSFVEQPYRAVIAIGEPELVTSKTLSQRRQAYSRRIQWGRWLSKIAEHPEPVERIERLFAGFEGFFGRQVVTSLPVEVVAAMVGVLPETAKTVQERYFNLGHAGGPTYLFPQDQQLTVSVISWDGLFRGDVVQPLQRATTMQEICRAYDLLKSA
ncbi:hypothetical protein IQ266_07690 [filamentous cyanobacterium LEGE 11480]|uniref:Uncharacterized protein n=1 Tax=Romeriopsis navalis LEGE 11480 TaxID=2777977 RepID=A0A928VP84_9CYAN|nr:hypothetical protein [Romeriopsis navalis LEGE 11480]